MNVERVLESIRRDFPLDPSPGFVYDVLRDRAAELDLAAHRRTVLEHFSSTLWVDELHPGRFTLLLATDPLNDLPVAFALVAKNDQGRMGRSLANLKAWGLMPRVVVAAGSKLHPALLEGLWPDADHRPCVFHVIDDIALLQPEMGSRPLPYLPAPVPPFHAESSQPWFSGRIVRAPGPRGGFFETRPP
jgi:hypothetical protein